MTIFIAAITSKVDTKPYKKKFAIYDKVLFGSYERTKNIIDKDTLYFKSCLTSKNKEQFDEVIKYAENYNDKNLIKIYANLKKNFFSRYCYFLNRVDGFSLSGIYSYLYLFRVHVKFAARFLDENKINFMFVGPASFGIDNVLYEVAKLKNIKIVNLFQMHNNHFFWVLDWKDLGTYSTSLPIFKTKKILTKKKIKDPYYMLRLINDKSLYNFFKIKVFNNLDFIKIFYYVFNIFINIIKYRITKKIEELELLLNTNKIKFIVSKYIRSSNERLRKTLEYKFKEDNSKYIKILYFLRVQPEATEGFASQIYDDQSVIIDHLESISDINTRIFIKEHPDKNRDNPMAKNNFWKSIVAKKNIYVLPMETKASDLLKHFDIIATYDGTIGWEAIRNLKPVICYGRPWYLMMPGVFYADNLLKISDVFKKKWTIDDLNKSLTKLTSKMGVGYVNHLETGTINAVDEFTNFKSLTKISKVKLLNKNDEVVSNSLLKIYKGLNKLNK